VANGTFKMKMNIDRHGPRLMPNNCKNLNPPYFSLPTAFKEKFPDDSEEEPLLIKQDVRKVFFFQMF
jgi:hypothetical protein